MKRIVTLGLALVCHFAVAQSEETAKIEVLYGGYFSKSEDNYPGASIFERDESGPVRFRHKGALLDCDVAYLYGMRIASKHMAISYSIKEIRLY